MPTITTNASSRSWSPDLNVFAPSEVVPDSLIMTTSTVAGSIEGDAPLVRVSYVDDAAAQFSAEGDEIPEADPDLSECPIATGKITQLLRLSREQFYQVGAAGELSVSVQRAVVKKANEAYLTQPLPTPPAVSPAGGLLNTPGITAGAEVDTDLDALVDLFALIQSNGGDPSHLVIDPLGWASLRKLKTASGSATSLLGAGTNDSVPMLLGVPVQVSPAMPAKSGLVIDKAAVVSAVGKVVVAQSDQRYFDSDSIGLRCTWRIGQNVVRPDRIGKFTIA